MILNVILIENLIVLELKSVSAILDVHKFQVLNYMNLLKVQKEFS